MTGSLSWVCGQRFGGRRGPPENFAEAWGGGERGRPRSGGQPGPSTRHAPGGRSRCAGALPRRGATRQSCPIARSDASPNDQDFNFWTAFRRHGPDRGARMSSRAESATNGQTWTTNGRRPRQTVRETAPHGVWGAVGPWAVRATMRASCRRRPWAEPVGDPSISGLPARGYPSDSRWSVSARADSYRCTPPPVPRQPERVNPVGRRGRRRRCASLPRRPRRSRRSSVRSRAPHPRRYLSRMP